MPGSWRAKWCFTSRMRTAHVISMAAVLLLLYAEEHQHDGVGNAMSDHMRPSNLSALCCRAAYV